MEAAEKTVPNVHDPDFLQSLHNRITELEQKLSPEALKEHVEEEFEQIENDLKNLVLSLTKRVQALEQRGSSAQLTPAPADLKQKAPSNTPPVSTQTGEPPAGVQTTQG